MNSLEPGVFWRKINLTLRSPLTPQEVREELSGVAPRFDVDTGGAVTGPRLFRRSRVFFLRVEERAFRVSGPLFHRGSALAVQGSIEPENGGSLIRLIVRNLAPVTFFIIGAFMFALLVCAAVLDAWPVMIFAGVPLICLGCIRYVITSIRARAGLKPLVYCLETMLSAQEVL